MTPIEPPCYSSVAARFRCHLTHGKSNELCLQAELLEKRCLSDHLCKSEGSAYYQQIIGHIGGTCSDFAEAFAFPMSEQHVNINAKISGDYLLKSECRRRAYDLAQCLQQERAGRKTIENQVLQYGNR